MLKASRYGVTYSCLIALGSLMMLAYLTQILQQARWSNPQQRRQGV